MHHHKPLITGFLYTLALYRLSVHSCRKTACVYSDNTLMQAARVRFDTYMGAMFSIYSGGRHYYGGYRQRQAWTGLATMYKFSCTYDGCTHQVVFIEGINLGSAHHELSWQFSTVSGFGEWLVTPISTERVWSA